MELNAEWANIAKKRVSKEVMVVTKTEATQAQIDTLTLYANAVEALLKDRIEIHKTNAECAETKNQRRAAMSALGELNDFYNKLIKLTPTTNE